MPAPIAPPLRRQQVPTLPDGTPPERARGPGFGSNPPTSSPVNAYLSPRGGPEAALPRDAGMGRPALRAARLPHQATVGQPPAWGNRPPAPPAADLPKVERRLARWANAAKHMVLPDPRVTGIGAPLFTATKSQSIDATCAAVHKAARTHATSLQIHSLQATRLPSAALGELQGLEHLSVKGTLCSKLDFTPNLASLKELELHGNAELGMLPENIRVLQSLTTLDIRMSPLLRSLPTGIGTLPRLETLRVANARIQHLPITLTDLGNSLRTLEVSAPPSPAAENGLRNLPENMGSLKSLTTLRLRHQEGLQELPASLGELARLETLDLSGCSGLKDLPDLSKLRNLKKLDLSGCINLKPLPASLAKLPAGCEIIVPHGQQRQQLNALRPASPPRWPAAAGMSSPTTSPSRPAVPAAAQQQVLDGWKEQLKPFKAKGERGADRFNIWLGALLNKFGAPPDIKETIQAVVDAAAASPDFRARLFAFAAANVEVPRNAFGIRQPDRATVANVDVNEVHNLRLVHQVTGPQVNADQASRNLKDLARNDISFARQLMALATERPPRPGAAGSSRAPVPPVLAAYVQAHDREGREILQARRTLEAGQGGRSSPDDAAAHAATLQVNDALLRGRHVAVAKQVMNALLV